MYQYKFRVIPIIGFLMLGSMVAATHSYQSSQVITSTSYVITRNSDMGRTAIWQIETTSEAATLIYELRGDSGMDFNPPTTFSPREVSMLPDNLMNLGIAQGISQIWQQGKDHLIVLTYHERCDRLLTNRCFGYFEFLLLDTNYPSNPRSLLKLDYHNALTDIWGCSYPAAFTYIYVDKVIPNPQFPAFAITLKGNCKTEVERSETIILNYADNVIDRIELPFTSGASWSPDGNYLAYSSYKLDECRGLGCFMTISRYDVLNNTTEVVASCDSAVRQYFSSTRWIDNDTIEYQWSIPVETVMERDVAITVEYQNIWVQHNLKDDNKIELPFNPIIETPAVNIAQIAPNIQPLFPPNEEILSMVPAN